MRRNVIEAIQGIEIFPIISLIIFFAFFMIMLVWVFRLDKKFITEASNMPLEDDGEVTDLFKTDPKKEETHHVG